MNEDEITKYYEAGVCDGKHELQKSIGTYLENILYVLNCATKTVPNEDFLGELYVIAAVYAYLYGSSDIFKQEASKGRILSPVELRYDRIATTEELYLTQAALEEKWFKEAFSEK